MTCNISDFDYSSSPFPYLNTNDENVWKYIPIDFWRYEVLPFLCKLDSSIPLNTFRYVCRLFYLLSLQYIPSSLNKMSSLELTSKYLLFPAEPHFIGYWIEKEIICHFISVSDSIIYCTLHNNNFVTCNIEIKPTNLEKTHFLFSKRSILDFVSHTDQIWTVASLCGGTRLISGSKDKTVKIWNVEDGSCIKTLEGHSDWVRCVCVVVGGEEDLIVSGSDDKTLKVWNIEGKCLKTLKGHSHWIYCVIPFDTKHVLSGSYDYTVKLWNVMDGEGVCIKTFEGHSESVWCLCKYDDRHFLSGSYDSDVKFWNISKEKCVSTLIGHNHHVSSLILIENGWPQDQKCVVSGSFDKTIRIWTLTVSESCEDDALENGIWNCLKILQVNSYVYCLTLFRNRYLFAGQDDGTVSVWDFGFPLLVNRI